VGGLGLVGYLLAFLGTLMAAGDWWYETFITAMLRSRVPGDFRGGTDYLGSYQRVCDVRGVRCGVVDLWILQLPAGIFPRGASILMMLGRSGRTKHDSARRPPLFSHPGPSRITSSRSSRRLAPTAAGNSAPESSSRTFSRASTPGRHPPLTAR